MMGNMRSDTERFRSAFNDSVKKSTIRGTSREKDSKNLVTSFKNQVETMHRNFKDRQKADAELPVVLTTSNQIDQLLHDISFDDRTNSIWAKVKTELSY